MSNPNGQRNAHEQIAQAAQDGELIAALDRAHEAREKGEEPEPADEARILAALEKPIPSAPWNAEQIVDSYNSPDETERRRARAAMRRLLDPDTGRPQPVRMTEIGEVSAREWLIDQWLPRGRIGMLTGEGGFGKSRLALQVAAAMTNGGGSWLPRGLSGTMPNVSCGTVVFATWEDEPVEFKRRIGQQRAEAMKDCHIVDLARFGPLWGAQTDTPLQNRGRLLPLGVWLRGLCEQTEADLLIVDSLAGAFGGNENDRAQVREFMADWDGWGRAADCAVMLISHPSQTGQRQSGGYSGSTDWHGASRWRWNMETEDTDKRQLLKLTKANYAQNGSRVYIERGGKDKLFDWCQAGDQTQTVPDGADKTKEGEEWGPQI